MAQESASLPLRREGAWVRVGDESRPTLPTRWALPGGLWPEQHQDMPPACAGRQWGGAREGGLLVQEQGKCCRCQ